MKPHGIPICNYPATVVLIDDDPLFLEHYAALIRNIAPCSAFSEPQEALDFLEDTQQNSFIDRCCEQAYSDDITTNLQLDETKIHHEIYNAERYSDIAVIIIDYNLYDRAELNGVEVCKKLARFNAQKILLTGEADETIAVDAFNEGIIDAYIKKDRANVPSFLLNKIREHRTKHFLQLSHSVKRMLANKDYEALSKCFVDDRFAEFFYRFLEEHQIIEHYFVSGPANLLLLDKNGSPSWLCIKDENEMADMIHFALDQYESEPNEEIKPLFDQIENKELLLFSYSDKDFSAGTDEWERLLHPCKKIECGPNTYYYAYIKGQSGYEIEKERIGGLTDYLARS